MDNILFRADSSSVIGTGHVMRDLVLASKFKDAKIVFAVQNLDGNINHKIEEAGYKLEILNSSSIEELNRVIKKYDIDMIVIDHYDIDASFEKKLKEQNPHIKLFVLDDIYKKHYCDILLNHNIFAEEKKYISLLPLGCRVLAGERYTLISDIFKKEKNKKYKKEGIFIALGGNDTKNLILKILKQLRGVKVNLYTTSANQQIKRLKRYAYIHRNIALHIDEDVAKGMNKSLFGIISSSTIAYEAIYMKLDFIAIKTMQNQTPLVKFLKKRRYNTIEIREIYKLKRLIWKKNLKTHLLKH